MSVRRAKERILFVCSGNLHRSPTAEEMYRKDERYEVDSCGTDRYAENPCTQRLVDWADRIFVMEERHRSAIRRFRVDERRITVLDIPDIYDRGVPTLKEVLKKRLEPHLG